MFRYRREGKIPGYSRPKEIELYIAYHEFCFFRDLFHEQCGIFLEDNKKYLVEIRLAELVKESQCSGFGEFCRKLKNSSIHSTLFKKLFDTMTTHETLWFRDEKPFQVLENLILPKFAKEIRDEKRTEINIWSAACSSGQEPYSIAMTALEYFNSVGLGWFCENSINILATDISDTTLSLAQNGVYDRIAISRGLPEEYLERYFTHDNNHWVIDDNVKKMIIFKQLNLKDPFGGIFSKFDIVFLRNVIIYFSDTFKEELLKRIAKNMVPRGYLFLGAGETISVYSNEYDINRFEGAVFYRQKVD